MGMCLIMEHPVNSGVQKLINCMHKKVYKDIIAGYAPCLSYALLTKLIYM